MSLELVKERIVLDNKAGKQSTQLLLEGDIIVPDNKPDVDTILRAQGTVKLEDEKVSDGRISFKGELEILCIYQAKKSEKLIHSMTVSLPIEDFINMDGITKDTKVSLWAVLSHLEHKLINDRKISIKAVIMVTASAENEFNGEIIKEIHENPEIQTLMGTLKVNNTVENKKDRFMIKEELVLSSGKPNIREIIETDVRISDKEVRPLDGKVSIKGNLNISTLYIGDNDESIVEIMEHEVPFNGFIEAKDVTENMMARAGLSVENADIQVGVDDDGEERILECEITVAADLKVSDNEDIDLIEDAYCLNRPLDITREKIDYPRFVAKNKNQSTIKETVTIDGQYPDMMQVEKVWGTVSVDGIELKNDRLEVQGVINLEVMYIAESDANPVSVVPVSIPFLQEIEVKGAREDMAVDVIAEIEDITFNMLSNEEVEIRVTLSFDVMVLEDMNGEIITNIDFKDGQEVQEPVASVVIYVVQPGDSLWSIAKRYNTTIEDLLLLNDIENPDKIYPGQKLLILKKITE